MPGRWWHMSGEDPRPPALQSRYRLGMATGPRGALENLITALHAHLAAVESDHGEETEAVLSASDTLSDVFEAYDEALYEEYGLDTPLVVDDGDDEGDDYGMYAVDAGALDGGDGARGR